MKTKGSIYFHILIALTVSILLSIPVKGNAAVISGYVNNVKIPNSSISTVKDKTFIEINTYFKILGYSNSQINKISSTFKNQTSSITIYLGKKSVTLNGAPIPITTNPFLYNNKIMMDINDLTLFTKESIQWNSNKTVFNFIPKIDKVISINPPKQSIKMVKGDISTTIRNVASKITSPFKIVSSNPFVATVDANYNIRALNEGYTTITISGPGIKPYSVPYQVVSPNQYYFNFNSSIQINKNETAILSVSLKSNPTKKLEELGYQVSYSSENPEIATVTSKGVAKGITVGKTIIDVKIDSIILPIEVTIQPSK